MSARRTFYWDFFGPNAEGTAAHFERHLSQFLAEHGLEGCVTGTDSAGEGHRAAFCTADEAAWPRLEGALRPRRWRDEPAE